MSTVTASWAGHMMWPGGAIDNYLSALVALVEPFMIHKRDTYTFKPFLRSEQNSAELMPGRNIESSNYEFHGSRTTDKCGRHQEASRALLYHRGACVVVHG
jgi:hypothetical protein